MAAPQQIDRRTFLANVRQSGLLSEEELAKIIGIIDRDYLVEGVLRRAITQNIARLRDIGTGDVRAFLGPCIRAPRYEFGAHDLAPAFTPDADQVLVFHPRRLTPTSDRGPRARSKCPAARARSKS